MEIQRYLSKDDKGELFDEGFRTLYATSFLWYITREKIGICLLGNNGLTKDFLTTDEKLFVRKYPPLIVRAQNVSDLRQSLRRGKSIDYGVKQLHMEPLETLIGILLSEEQTYCYLSIAEDNLEPEITTFSLVKPSQDLYVLGKKMSVEQLTQKTYT